MSETAEPPATAMPMFYTRVVGVAPNEHGQMRLDRGAGMGFAAHAQAVPLGLGEFEAAARSYPIVFTTGDNCAPVALLGLTAGHNCFIGANGRWLPDSYVPAYVRSFPFIFVEDAAANTTYVGMEADAECISPEIGAKLFEDGKPTAVLNDAVAFCSALRDNLTAAATFAKALDTAGVLAEEEATVNFTAGGGTRIRGFKLIRRDRLDALPDETWLDWRRRGWLGALYAHLHSSWQWGRLIDLSAPK